MSRHKSSKAESCEDLGEIRLASRCIVASAHAEAARQHAAAADAHALAAELHYEALAPEEDSDSASRQDAVCASADALTQTGTAAEASELSDADFGAIRDAQQEAHDASRLAEDGEDPRKAHAQSAKHHALLAKQHAWIVQTIAARSQEAHDAAFDANVGLTRSRDAELAAQDA